MSVLCPVCKYEVFDVPCEYCFLKARVAALEAERDRQYEFNAGAIAKIAALEAQVQMLRDALLKRGLSYAPCDICGYNGPRYYQPATHPCAALAATEETK